MVFKCLAIFIVVVACLLVGLWIWALENSPANDLSAIAFILFWAVYALATGGLWCIICWRKGNPPRELAAAFWIGLVACVSISAALRWVR